MSNDYDYTRIAEAIDYLKRNFKAQPSLQDVAEHIHLSPYHFQRLFKTWAGVTPKQFLQYVSIEHAKAILEDRQASLFDAALETGLSGTSRLHDLFVKIEGMTPGEYRNGGEHLDINYSFAESPFGMVIIASTFKGICYMAFFDTDRDRAFEELKSRFPNARYRMTVDLIQQQALFIFTQDWSKLGEIKLHLKGTEFQIKVWEALLKVPMGDLSTYSAVAREIGNAGASRAVGSAIGDNPVAFLIPCHRAIKATGEIGEYHWGSVRKNAMIGWEASRVFGDTTSDVGH